MPTALVEMPKVGLQRMKTTTAMGARASPTRTQPVEARTFPHRMGAEVEVGEGWRILVKLEVGGKAGGAVGA